MNRLSDVQRQNVLDLIAAGYSNSAIQRQTGITRLTIARYRAGHFPAPRTTAGNEACRNGHPYPENQRADKNGWHYCAACHREKNRRWRARNPQRAQPDEMAVLRAVQGDPPDRLTPRERAEAIRQLTRKGLTVELTAERLRCHRNTVKRARKRLRAAA
ncbi:helix-turn-helix domain-containing protein [Streptomyces huasconensis]|uniref:Helix-turn-helix domain-containing protein n=1 Tax=Streptomyces huasconensis TaxID=1854574 RepID=A0ABV3M1R2_9ACTN